MDKPAVTLSLEQLNWIMEQFKPIPYGYIINVARFLEAEVERQNNGNSEDTRATGG